MGQLLSKTRRFIVAALVLATGAALVLLGSGTSVAGHGDRADDPLRILLTNDDGWKAPGIQALYRELRTAGHEVTMVAPLTSQSGASVKTAFGGTLSVTHPDPADPSITAVAGTTATGEISSLAGGSPADTVFYGLAVPFAAAPPDLVVSGCNFGQNIGRDSILSGTVGAAVAAAIRGVPAIACSDRSDFLANPVPTPDFDGSAAFITRLVNVLQGRSHDRRLLPRGILLNVNYPFMTGGQPPRGVRVAPVSTVSEAKLTYTPRASDSTLFDIGFEVRTDPDPQSDLALLNRGYITITPFQDNLGAPTKYIAQFKDLARRLGR